MPEVNERLRNPKGLQARLDRATKRREVLDRSYISFANGEQIRIPIKNDTYILPVVNNLLVGNTYEDGKDKELQRLINLYTAKKKNGYWTLELITTLIHGSELFIGETEYGMNVFCLVSDLGPEEVEKMADKIIQVKDLDDFFKTNGLYGKANKGIEL